MLAFTLNCHVKIYTGQAELAHGPKSGSEFGWMYYVDECLDQLMNGMYQIKPKVSKKTWNI